MIPMSVQRFFTPTRTRWNTNRATKTNAYAVGRTTHVRDIDIFGNPIESLTPAIAQTNYAAKRIGPRPPSARPVRQNTVFFPRRNTLRLHLAKYSRVFVQKQSTSKSKCSPSVPARVIFHESTDDADHRPG